MKKGKLLLFFSVLIFISACGPQYQPITSPSLPANIKKVAIELFANNTSKYGLEEKLYRDIVEEFMRDGRLIISDKENADALLTGEIIQYIKEPLSYDENYVVEQYKIWVIVNVKFVDLKQNLILWEEKRENLIGGFEGEVRYYVSPHAGEIVETEEEAQERLTQEIAENIVRRVFYGW